MTPEELEELARTAGSWAKAYVRLKNELMARGIPEAEAVKTARTLSTAAMMRLPDPEDEAESWKG